MVCGEKRAGRACLEVIRKHEDAEIAGIVTSADDWQADLATWGGQHGIDVHLGHVREHVEAIRDAEPDVLFSIQYSHLVPAEILELPTIGSFNLHFSLLPRHGGCYPIAWAILAGDDETGATLHEMTPRFDDGPIVAQTRVAIDDETTARELHERVTDAAVDLFRSRLDALLSGQVDPTPQNPSQRVYHDKDSIDFDAERWIDWTEPAQAVQRRIQAFTFPPFQLPASVLEGGDERHEVSITSTEPLDRPGRGPGSEAPEPGKVHEANPDRSIDVLTGDGGRVRVSKIDERAAVSTLEDHGLDPEQARFTSR